MIELRNVSKIYGGGHRAVDDVSLTVDEGETVVLIGSSGCGKTTTLKMINRLIEPSSGEIHIKGRNAQQLNAVELRRDIGYVIQQIGLFPHMTIQENVELVPSLLGWAAARKHERARELMELVGLAPGVFSSRFPHELSGGQRQRVGVARALAVDPPILLMDEPFGALDPLTRRDIQEEFLNLKRQIKKTIVFVTHDIIEAVTLGDRLAVMDRGRVIQLGSPRDILNKPASEAVQQIIGHQRFQLTLSSITADDIVDKRSTTASTEILQKPIREVRRLTKEEGIAILPVLDEEGKLVSVILPQELYDAAEDAPTGAHASREPCTIPHDATLLTALNLMIEKKQEAFSVTDRAGMFKGVLSRRRLFDAVDTLFTERSPAGAAN